MIFKDFVDDFVTDEMDLDPTDSYVMEDWLGWLTRKAQAGLRLRWDAADWDFRTVTDDTLSTSAGEPSVELPDNFQRFGTRGMVIVPNTRPLVPKPPDFVRSAQQAGGGPISTPGLPYFYAPFHDGASAPVLLLAPVPASAESLFIQYERKCPELVYEEAPSADELDQVPEEFVTAVLLPDLRVRYFRFTSNADALAEAKQELREGLVQMMTRFRQDQNVIEQMGEVGLSDLGQW